MDIGQKGEVNASIQISIIVPITRMYGRLDGLEKWLSEIDFSKVEVILVHDLQDEKTGVELHSLIASQPMARIIEQTFLSAGLARNAGLKASQGEWILFWDSDDQPDVSTLHNFLELPNKPNFDLFVFNFRIEKDGAFSNIQTGTWRELAVHPGIWRIVFSKSSVSGHIFPSFPLGEDQHFLAQLNLPHCHIGYIDANLYTYKIGVIGQATSNNSNLFRLKESLLALNSIRSRQNGEDFEFTSILYWRQLLTLLRRGNVFLKLQTISLILGNFLKPNPGYLINFKALNYLLRRLAVRHG
jgi:glycosyltransferase involved in cell wall biosynthesis